MQELSVYRWKGMQKMKQEIGLRKKYLRAILNCRPDNLNYRADSFFAWADSVSSVLLPILSWRHARIVLEVFSKK